MMRRSGGDRSEWNGWLGWTRLLVGVMALLLAVPCCCYLLVVLQWIDEHRPKLTSPLCLFLGLMSAYIYWLIGRVKTKYDKRQERGRTLRILEKDAGEP